MRRTNLVLDPLVRVWYLNRDIFHDFLFENNLTNRFRTTNKGSSRRLMNSRRNWKNA
jgi:hypothetical protein